MHFPFYNSFNWRTSPPRTGREWWTRKWNRPMRQCYCPCSCSRCCDWALTGTTAWSSWRAGPTRSWGSGCCCWTGTRTGRPFGDLCSGAPAEGAGRFPPVVADTRPPVLSPAETPADHKHRQHINISSRVKIIHWDFGKFPLLLSVRWKDWSFSCLYVYYLTRTGRWWA